MEFKKLVASGALTPSLLHALWLEYFPTNPRTASRGQAEQGFIPALLRLLPSDCDQDMRSYEVEDDLCGDGEQIRIADLHALLRKWAKRYETPIPVSLTVPQEVTPFLCTPPAAVDAVTEFLRSNDARRSGCFLATLPIDLVHQVALYAVHAPLVSRWRHVQGGALCDAYTFADGVALFSCQSRMIRPSSVSIHALSLANGETVWQSAAVMKSRAPVYMRVMADGMVILASGTKVAVLKPPNVNRVQFRMKVPSYCAALELLDRSAYVLCKRMVDPGPAPRKAATTPYKPPPVPPYTLHKLTVDTAPDGWPLCRLTEIARWDTRPTAGCDDSEEQFEAARIAAVEPALSVAHSAVHGEVCAALTAGLVVVYLARTGTTLRLDFDAKALVPSVLVTDSSLYLLLDDRVSVYPLHDVARRTDVALGALDTPNQQTALYLLADGLVAAIVWTCTGLLVVLLDNSGSAVHRHLTPTNLAPPTPDHFARYGNEWLVCAAPDPGPNGELLLHYLSLRRAVSHVRAYADVRPFPQRIRVHGGLIIGWGRGVLHVLGPEARPAHQ